MDWQLTAVVVSLAGAVGYLSWVGWRMWKRGKTGCGGGGACAGSTAVSSAETSLIPSHRLNLRQRTTAPD